MRHIRKGSRSGGITATWCGLGTKHMCTDTTSADSALLRLSGPEPVTDLCTACLSAVRALLPTPHEYVLTVLGAPAQEHT
ncbi:hypothetical protein [Deinococcus sp. PEB2-67]